MTMVSIVFMDIILCDYNMPVPIDLKHNMRTILIMKVVKGWCSTIVGKTDLSDRTIMS